MRKTSRLLDNEQGRAGVLVPYRSGNAYILCRTDNFMPHLFLYNEVFTEEEKYCIIK